MRKSATLIERIILESLAKKDRDLKELGEDTGLAESFLKVILQQMLHKGWLLYSRGSYSLLIEEELGWVDSINDKKALALEIKELMTSMVEMYFKENQGLLKVQKLNLSEEEEKTLNIHLKNLDQFFQSVRSEKSKKPKLDSTKKQRVVVWGSGLYSDVLGANLQAI